MRMAVKTISKTALQSKKNRTKVLFILWVLFNAVIDLVCFLALR